MTTNATTPENSEYRSCRPLWCGVQKTRSVQASCDVFISVTTELTPSLDLIVQDTVDLSTSLQVLIAPEP